MHSSDVVKTHVIKTSPICSGPRLGPQFGLETGLESQGHIPAL